MAKILDLPLEILPEPPVAVMEPDDEEMIIEECYVTGEDNNLDLLTAADVKKTLIDALSMQGLKPDEVVQESDLILDVEKSMGGAGLMTGPDKVVAPPYSADLMLHFMGIDQVVHQCVRVKAQDYVGRDWKLSPVAAEKLTDKYDAEDEAADASAYPDKYPADFKTVTDFLKSANNVIGVDSALLKAAQDYEGVGWAALEVIRSMDMKVTKVDHIPANRLKVMHGWSGFVETGPDGKKRYYQPFGNKVVAEEVDPITKKKIPYNPDLHGELTEQNPLLEWNLISLERGEPTDNFMESASEVIWIPRHHPATIYYGVSDNVPATADILANAKIREYLLQFFDHNTVPRYVVVIKGAKLSPEVKKTILDYFSTHVRGRAHKTLVLPIPSGRGNIEVTFEKLDSDPADGWFRKTSQDNNENIRIAHGVPTSVATFPDASGMGSGKGLAQAEIYKDRVVTPGQKLWAGILNKVFRLGLGITTVELSFDELDTRDKEAVMRVNTQYMDRGAMTINEVRRDLNLPPIKGGDRAFIKTPKGPIFIDEVADMKSMEADPGSGGDRSLNTPEKRGPGNSAQNVLENFSRNTSDPA